MIMEQAIQEGKDVISGDALFRHTLVPRVAGYMCAGLAIHQVFLEQGGAGFVLPVLVAQCLLLPAIFYFRARQSRNPYRTERQNLLLDSLICSLWVSFMGVDQLPSLLLITLICMNNLAYGGLSMLVQGLGIALVIQAVTFHWHTGAEMVVHSPPEAVLQASLPLMVIYPLLTSWVLFRVSSQMQQHRKDLLYLSQHDGLTGLLNRRSWNRAAVKAMSQAQESQSKISIMMIDIDHFKQVNDSLGHVAGDTVIQNVASILQEQLQGSATVGRYGGEEFGVILRNVSEFQASEIADTLRRSVAEKRFRVQGYETAMAEVSVSVSIGIAEYRATFETLELWVQAADMAMYNAKSQGRNRVSGWQ